MSWKLSYGFYWFSYSLFLIFFWRFFYLNLLTFTSFITWWFFLRMFPLFIFLMFFIFFISFLFIFFYKETLTIISCNLCSLQIFLERLPSMGMTDLPEYSSQTAESLVLKIGLRVISANSEFLWNRRILIKVYMSSIL